MRIYLTFSLILILLTSCAPAISSKPSSEPTLSEVSLSPEATPSPSSTPTLSPTPTPQIPVLIGTPFPKSLEVINKNIVQNLQNLVTFQNGHMLTRFTEDLEKLYIADQSGITVCKTRNSDEFVDCESVLNHFDIFLGKNSDLGFSPGDFMITPSGSHFLAVTDKGLQVFSEQGKDFFTYMLPEGEFSFALSPDGKFVSILRNDRVIVIRTENGEEVFADEGSLARFTPGGKYLAVQKSMAVYLYSVVDWSNTYSFPQNQKDGWDISGNGDMIANNSGKDLVIHRLSDGEYIKTIKRIGGGDVLLSHEGKFAFMVISTPSAFNPFTKQISFWDIEKEEKVYARTIEVIDLSNLVIGDDGIGRYFNVEKPWKSVAKTQKIYLTSKDDILINSSGEICLLTQTSKTVCDEIDSSYFFDQSGKYFKQMWKENFESKDLLTCSINKNAGEDGELFKGNQCTVVDEGNTLDSNYSLKAVIPQINLALVHYKNFDTRVIDLKTGNSIKEWKGEISFPITSADNRYFAFLYQEGFFSSLRRLGVYDAQENEYLFLGNENRPSSYAFTKENLLVGIINEQTRDGKDKIVAYDLNNKETVPIELISYEFDVEPEIGRLNAIAFSPDETILISGTDKGYILVYDFSTKALITRWQAFDNASILAVAFTRDGRNIITSSEFGEIKLWGAAPFEWNTGE